MFNYAEQRNLFDFIVKLDCKIDIPKGDRKNVVLSRALLLKNILSSNKNAIIQQIYILNKLYNKQITSKKRDLDETIENFVQNFDKTGKNKMSICILKAKCKELSKAINDFAKYEFIVKQNVNSYIESESKYLDFINNHHLFNNKPTKFNGGLGQTLPSVNFCKTDLNKKIDYINSLYDEKNTCILNEVFENGK